MTPVVDRDGNEVNDHGKPYRNGHGFPLQTWTAVRSKPLAWNFRNNYELAVDSFGTMWQSDNDDDGNRGVRINYVMEYGNFGLQRRDDGAGWPAGWEKGQIQRRDGRAKGFLRMASIRPRGRAGFAAHGRRFPHGNHFV